MKMKMHTEDKIPYWKEQSPFSFDEVERIEASKRKTNHPGWERSYLVKPYEYMLGYRKTRSQNELSQREGARKVTDSKHTDSKHTDSKHTDSREYPYISFFGYEILKMAYAFKILLRRSANEAVFRSPDKTEHSITGACNKAIKGLYDKEYLDRDKFPLTQEYMYDLTLQGLQFLDSNKAITPWFAANRERYMALNELFSRLCKNYRQTYFIEWLVEPEFCNSELGVDAVLTLWDDVARWKASESVAYHVIKSNFVEDQVQEILQTQHYFIEWLEKDENLRNFPVKPSLYVLKPEIESMAEEYDTLKVADKGSIWAGDGQIRQWLEL